MEKMVSLCVCVCLYFCDSLTPSSVFYWRGGAGELKGEKKTKSVRSRSAVVTPSRERASACEQIVI